MWQTSGSIWSTFTKRMNGTGALKLRWNFSAMCVSWNSAQNQCDGLISSVHYSFVWTFSGNIGDPQAEIISINREYNNGQTLRHRNDSKNKQPYYFETTISWIFLPGKTETLQLPPPNLFFSVPDDFFYPFSLSRS